MFLRTPSMLERRLLEEAFARHAAILADARAPQMPEYVKKMFADFDSPPAVSTALTDFINSKKDA